MSKSVGVKEGTVVTVEMTPDENVTIYHPVTIVTSVQLFPTFGSAGVPSVVAVTLSAGVPVTDAGSTGSAHYVIPSVGCGGEGIPGAIAAELVPVVAPLLGPVTVVEVAAAVVASSVEFEVGIPGRLPAHSN